MTYRLLVTDLDGTLLDPTGIVHDADREAVAALLDQGVAVSICTGRMYSGTRSIARGLKLAGPIGCIDGSHIVDAANDRALMSRTLHGEVAEALFGVLYEYRPVTFVFADDVVFHDGYGKPYLGYVTTWSNRIEQLEDVLDDPRWIDKPCVSALVSLGTEKQIRGAEARLQEKHAHHLQAISFEVHRGGFNGVWGMVVRAAGVSKGTALEWIAEHYGVSLAETVAVGDWLNDIPMMQAAGRSFAMAQAPDNVKAAATDQLEADAWSGGGIAEAALRAKLL